jgi:hypothetical protein
MMRLLSNRRRLAGLAVVGAWQVLGGCNGSPVGVVDDDAGNAEGGAGDATSEAAGDATIDGHSDGPTGTDASNDRTMTMSDAGTDAPADAASDAVVDAVADAAADAPTDAVADAAADAPADALADAAADAPLEAAPCTFAGTWSVTVQTVTAVPTLCQGVMDCTNCGILFNAAATQSTPTTIDWNVDPGGTLCTAFSGSITPAGQFTTSETNCSPAGNGSTFEGQIDLGTCSMTATYVYVLSNCTITETMTGTQ